MKDIWKIIRYSASLKRYYIATAVFVVVTSVLSLATPFLLKMIVDAIVAGIKGSHVSGTYIVVLVGLILVANIAGNFISNIQGYIGDQLGAKLNTLLSRRYFDHILSLPIGYFDNEITGRITSRLERSIVTISQLMQAFANNFLSMILTVVITLVVLGFYYWPVALLLAVLFPLYIWLTTLSSKTWQEYQESINRDTDYANGRFIEAVSQIRVVKSFVQENEESKIFASKRRAIENVTRVQSRHWHYWDIVRRLSLNIVFFLIYGMIVWQTYRGAITIGTMTLMLQLATQAQWPLFGASMIVESIQRAVSGSRDFFKVMETEAAIQDKSGADELTVSEGEVVYSAVDFGYNSNDKVLNDVTFTIKPGSKLALVGESGEGKTTIANLLLRFYETKDGHITIDGKDVREVSQASLRSSIGVVFQDPSLFSGTVEENIAYGRGKYTKQQLEAAAKAANAWDFIQKLPKGFATEIGERGVKLSGGQKQRIAIARAIMKNPPVLILDEATSSLDSKAEREVQEALEQLMAGRTTMIIAHRLSTIQNVDMIVGIRGGRVAEMGSPAELADAGGIYSELLALQTPTKANKAALKKYDIARV